jgi:hypothetical protein
MGGGVAVLTAGLAIACGLSILEALELIGIGFLTGSCFWLSAPALVGMLSVLTRIGLALAVLGILAVGGYTLAVAAPLLLLLALGLLLWLKPGQPIRVP